MYWCFLAIRLVHYHQSVSSLNISISKLIFFFFFKIVIITFSNFCSDFLLLHYLHPVLLLHSTLCHVYALLSLSCQTIAIHTLCFTFLHFLLFSPHSIVLSYSIFSSSLFTFPLSSSAFLFLVLSLSSTPFQIRPISSFNSLSCLLFFFFFNPFSHFASFYPSYTFPLFLLLFCNFLLYSLSIFNIPAHCLISLHYLPTLPPIKSQYHTRSVPPIPMNIPICFPSPLPPPSLPSSPSTVLLSFLTISSSIT